MREATCVAATRGVGSWRSCSSRSRSTKLVCGCPRLSRYRAVAAWVMGPAAPSSGPGLKPKEYSFAWTSLTSSRWSGAGAGVADADSTGVILAGAGSLAASGTTSAATGTIAREGRGEGAREFRGGVFGDEALDGGAFGDGAAGGDAINAGATAATSTRGARSALAILCGHDQSAGMTMSTVSPVTPAVATTAPAALRTIFNRRARARSYACSAARHASAAACGSLADRCATRSPSWRDRLARDRLKRSSAGPSSSLSNCRAVGPCSVRDLCSKLDPPSSPYPFRCKCLHRMAPRQARRRDQSGPNHRQASQLDGPNAR